MRQSKKTKRKIKMIRKTKRRRIRNQRAMVLLILKRVRPNKPPRKRLKSLRSLKLIGYKRLDRSSSKESKGPRRSVKRGTGGLRCSLTVIVKIMKRPLITRDCKVISYRTSLQRFRAT